MIWRAGLYTDSGFEGATEWKIFEVPFIVTEGEDPITGNNERKAGFICKGLLMDSLASPNNKFMESFLFRNCHVLTLVQDCGFEAQKIADLRTVLATFCGQEMAGASGGLLALIALPHYDFPLKGRYDKYSYRF